MYNVSLINNRLLGSKAGKRYSLLAVAAALVLYYLIINKKTVICNGKPHKN